MKIFVHAKPSAKETKIEKIDDAHFQVSVKEPAKDNKANFAILEALADYFAVPLSSVKMISGRTSRQKIIEIMVR